MRSRSSSCAWERTRDERTAQLRIGRRCFVPVVEASQTMKLLCVLSLLCAAAYPSDGQKPEVWYVSRSERVQIVFVDGGTVEEAAVSVPSQSLCECWVYCCYC
ncbi:hypothetical protein C7M84_003385 [Penaeus vannamei]|uniref:Uncharacterized protein n=1 Tax=Penaeus vannamei TaxID=6689 RepID=A0A3R7QG90_PENVA|nr:hypothetical protein C7M84_003385 [Penaeus vannamei]